MKDRIQGINYNYPGKFFLVDGAILSIFLSKFTII